MMHPMAGGVSPAVYSVAVCGMCVYGVRLDMMRRAWRMTVNRRVMDRSTRMHGV